MTDIEPRLREELERWEPLREVRRWDDVLVRAGESGRRSVACALRRRRLVLAGAAVVALVAAGTAYAIAREFFVGDPAPPSVKEQAAQHTEAVKGELIPRVHETPGIRVEETRLAAALDASTGPVYLWVAPSARGPCLFTHVVANDGPDGRPNLGSDGCGSGGPPIRRRRGRLAHARRAVADAPLRARRRTIARLEIKFSGRTVAVP